MRTKLIFVKLRITSNSSAHPYLQVHCYYTEFLDEVQIKRGMYRAWAVMSPSEVCTVQSE